MISSSHDIVTPRKITFGLGLGVAALGISVLFGWAFNLVALISVLPGLAQMKPNTALTFLMSGVALALLSSPGQPRLIRAVVRVLAAIVLAIGAFTLAEYFFHWNPGFDQWLFHEVARSADTVAPARMSPATAFCSILVAWALLAAAQPVGTRLRLPLITALGAAVIVIGGLSMVGYLAFAVFKLHWWNNTGMAVHTAFANMVLGGALLTLARSEGKLIWALDAKFTMGFGLAIAVMLLAAGISYSFTNQLLESVTDVAVDQESLKQIQEIRADLSDLESIQRGYIITGDERLLAQRAQLKTAVNQSLGEVRQLTTDDPSEQQWLNQLALLITQRTDFGEQTIQARRQQGFPAAQQSIASGTGEVLTAGIDGLLKEIQDEEYAQLAAWQQHSATVSTTSLLMQPLGVFLSLTLLSLGVSILNSGMTERERAEEALHTREEQFSLFIEHSPAALAMFDRDMRYLAASRRWLADYGITGQTIIGRSHYEVFPDLPARWREIHQRCLAGAVETCAQEPFTRGDGTIQWIRWEVRPWRVPDGQIGGILIFSEDITVRKHDEEARTRLAAIVEHSTDAIIGKDLNSVVTSWNYGAQKIFGYSAGEMLGHSIMLLIPPDRHGEEEEILSRIKRGESIEHFETVRNRKDGTPLDVSVTVSPIKDASGQVLGASKIVRDVTERKQAEAKIRELNITLEQRVVERTAQLEAANKELEAFSYSVSHDLRAPLRAVDGFSQAVEEDYGPQLPEEGRRYLHTIREGAQRMGALIDDLLTFSRMSRMAIKKDLVNTGKLVRDVLAELNPRQTGRQVEIRQGELPPCHGDAALLKQVWINLLSNALKYTRKRESAVIEIGCQQEQGANVYFVRDNGTGFDMQYAHKLFGVFQRLHRAEDYEGTGVGLAIVQRIIHRHGGRVWADAALDHGATFYFTLEGKAKL